VTGKERNKRQVRGCPSQRSKPPLRKPLILRAFTLSLSLSLALGFWALAESAAAPKVDHVFIVSIDQASPAVIALAKMPTLQRLATEGAHTWEAFTIVPSLTLPAHTSMLTGLGIQSHQVTWNDFDPERGFVKVPTIFSLAKKRGLVTAMVAAKVKFKTLQVPRTLDAFILPENPSAKNVAEAFASMVTRLKPNLCFIHFGDADAAGHKFGVRSPEKLQALADCDAALQMILDAIAAAGLSESSVVILTSDHGGHDRPPEENASLAARGISPQPGTHGSAETADVVIPWIAWGPSVKKGFALTAPVKTYDTAATALWLLGLPLPDNF
jgi:predicted AlkP superfamily pyrophosphatase or phosphodiesterase